MVEPVTPIPIVPALLDVGERRSSERGRKFGLRGNGAVVVQPPREIRDSCGRRTAVRASVVPGRTMIICLMILRADGGGVRDARRICIATFCPGTVPVVTRGTFLSNFRLLQHSKLFSVPFSFCSFIGLIHFIDGVS